MNRIYKRRLTMLYKARNQKCARCALYMKKHVRPKFGHTSCRDSRKQDDRGKMRPYGWALILLDWYPYRNRLEYRHREKTM